MRQRIPSSLTIEEAVAEMISLDYIPPNSSLLDLLDEFLQEAEEKFHEAYHEHRLPESAIQHLASRMDACRARCDLAQKLFDHLKWEIEENKNSELVLASDSASQYRVTRESLLHWGRYWYGIGIMPVVPEDADETKKGLRWEDVTLEIDEEFEVSYGTKKYGRLKKTDFSKVLLKDKRYKDKLSKRGSILIRLGMRHKFPDKQKSEGNERAAIYRLRQDLCKLTGLSGNPFLKINEFDGWKPKFKIICKISQVFEDEAHLDCMQKG